MKITVSEYRWFLKGYAYDHRCLAEDYAGMQKVISLFEAFIKPEGIVYTQLKTLKKTLEKSQHINHRAHTSIHHRLNTAKAPIDGTFFKRVRRLLSFGCVSHIELGLCYLMVQEEEQVHAFLKTQHEKLKALLNQMYEPRLLEQLSRVDLSRVQSLELFLKRARRINKEGLKDCQSMRQDLKAHMPYTLPTTSFQSLMEHCHSWGSKAHTLPLKPKSLFARVSERCSVFW